MSPSLVVEVARHCQVQRPAGPAMHIHVATWRAHVRGPRVTEGGGRRVDVEALPVSIGPREQGPGPARTAGATPDRR